MEFFSPSTASGAFFLVIFGTTTPFPAEISAISTAMSHPWMAATLLIWFGAMTGAIISYGIGYLFGRTRTVTRLNSRRTVRAALTYFREPSSVGWLTVLGLRLIPMFPFFAVSLAAGLVRVPFRGYMAGTGFGILPMTALMVVAGNGLLSQNGWVVALTVLGLAGAAVLMVIWKRIKTRRRKLLPSGNPHIAPETLKVRNSGT